MRVLFLDVDGVLNRTGYRAASSAGLRSWIEPDLATNLNTVLRAADAQIVMSSAWRIGRDLRTLREELDVAGVVGTLLDATPVLEGAPRWREIETWMERRGVTAEHIAIVDDTFAMGSLAARFVRVSPLTGLNVEATAAIVALFAAERSGSP